MNAFLKKYHIVMRFFSLLIAAFLWFYVIYQENPERSVTFADVPVRLIGEETLRLRDDLVRTDTETPTVDVRLSGAVSLLNLKAEDIIIRSDVSRITEPGTYTLSYDISAIDGVAVSGRTPSEITVSFDRQVTLDLPVDVVYTGELHESLIADTAIVDPVTVRVTGIESEISSARYAQVTVDASSLASSFSGDLSYTVVDEEGEELSDNTYEKLDDTVHVEIPVYRERELPLKVELLYGNAALPSNSILTLSRDTVSVYGDIATVDALTELKIDTIDLSVQLGDFEKTYTLSLPDGVYLKDSANDTVTVHVGFVDLEVRQIVVNLAVNGEVTDAHSLLGEHVMDCWGDLHGPSDRSLVHWLRRLVFRGAWLDQRVLEGELEIVFDDSECSFGYAQPDRDWQLIELSPEPSWRRVAYRPA